MEIITIESVAYQQLLAKIDAICNKLEENKKSNPLSEIWLDISDACQLLKLSKRTLQNYRNNGSLAYSQIGGKIYFKAVDIENHLRKHYKEASVK